MPHRAWVALLLLGCRDRGEIVPRPVPKEVAASKPEPAPPPPRKPALETACATDADCTMTTFGDDCCDHCGNVAASKDSLDRLRKHCAQQKVSCPAIDCPFQPATAHCEKGACTRHVTP